MLDFDDRDLVEIAEAVGFARASLTLEIQTEPPEPMPWDVYVKSAWNPNVPTVGEAMEQALTREERRRYAAHMRPLVETGRGSERTASAYLVAVKASA